MTVHYLGMYSSSYLSILLLRISKVLFGFRSGNLAILAYLNIHKYVVYYLVSTVMVRSHHSYHI